MTDMKQIFRIFTLIAVAMLTAEQAWAGSAADLGFIKRGTVTGGDLMFYKEATCETKISNNSNLYSSDLTDGKVYIKATPDWNYTGIGVTFTAQVSTSSSPAEARSITRGSTAPGIGDAITVSPVSGKPNIYSFTMPADGENVTVSATFKEKPYLGDGTNAHISYYSYDAQGNRVTSNTGDDGHPRVYILDGSEKVLGEGNENPTWYVCNTTDLSYTSTLILNGDVHLILADNAKMTMDVVNGAIFGYSGDFYIYGQSDGENSGKLIATSDEPCITIDGNLYVNGGQLKATGSTGIYNTSGNITITGGQVEATGTTGDGIVAKNDITITGGQVEATGTTGAGIVAYNNVTISGGQVTATGPGTKGYGIISLQGGVTISGGQVIGSGTNYGIISRAIVLGWTNANDYIKVSKYSGSGIVKTAAGQRFVAYNMTSETDISATTIVSGSIANNNFTLADIDGKTLKPLDGYTVTVADGISVGTLSGTTFTAADPDFTITTGAGTESEVTTPYYIYKASTQEAPVTVTLSYSGTDFVTLGGLPEGTTLNAVENQPLQRSFAMPAQDVALTATAVTGLTASGDTYDYDGTAKTPTVKLGDDVFAATNYIVAYTKGGSAVSEAKKVGTYSCTVNGSGSYIGTIATDVAITINPKTVTVTSGISASNKTYDGTTTATLNGTNAVISGKVDGDDLSVSATGAFADKDAGTGKTVKISSITLTGNDKDNYVLASTGNQTTTSANISKKALTVTADDKSVSYGDAAPTYTASYSGFVSDESKSNLSGSLSFSCSYTSSSNTGTYSIMPSGYTSSNYNISYNNGTLTVTEADIDYTGGTITYDQNGYDITLDEGTGSANTLPSGIIDDLDYSRTLTAPGTGEGDVKIGGEAANLYTVCLPTAPITGTGATYYTLSGVEGNTLKFIEIDGGPAAFTPYLVAVKGSSNFTEGCSDVSFDTEHEIYGSTVDGYTFTGTLAGLSNAAAIAAASSGNATYILQDDAKWGKVVSGSVHLPPFRAFIVGPVLSAGARELGSSFDDGNATAIERIVTTDRDGTEHWYDMNGRRIEKPTTKGVYILNGRKEVIK